jgi:hypothetical protein
LTTPRQKYNGPKLPYHLEIFWMLVRPWMA